jgi:hypothetical protein
VRLPKRRPDGDDSSIGAPTTAAHGDPTGGRRLPLNGDRLHPLDGGEPAEYPQRLPIGTGWRIGSGGPSAFENYSNPTSGRVHSCPN